MTTTDQYGVRSEYGTEISRVGSAVRTTIRLIALFRITACNATNPNRPISRGEPEFGAAEPDHAAEHPDHRTRSDSQRQ
ncbi:hypothetical protein FMUBM48_08350 [Nocardia cyriacigeorgica]|nr:hypothetical protein FMUBM48_08350 [Nocardia cyriacigeorgica]